MIVREQRDGRWYKAVVSVTILRISLTGGSQLARAQRTSSLSEIADVVGALPLSHGRNDRG